MYMLFSLTKLNIRVTNHHKREKPPISLGWNLGILTCKENRLIQSFRYSALYRNGAGTKGLSDFLASEKMIDISPL